MSFKGLPSLTMPRIFKFRFKKPIRYALWALFLLIIVGIVGSYQANQVCKFLDVKVISTEENAFLETKEIEKIIQEGYGKSIVGMLMSGIDLRKVEEILKASPYVLDAQVSKTFRSKLNIEVKLREPMVRVINQDGSSLYIDKTGIKFPTKHRHSSNVPLIRGVFYEVLTPKDSFSCELIKHALPVVKFIDEDPFWKSQISEIYIMQSNELVFYPEVGSLSIEFGEPKRIEEKFENMRIFYDQVLKEVGWNKYKSFSVKFKGQVVGKK